MATTRQPSTRNAHEREHGRSSTRPGIIASTSPVELPAGQNRREAPVAVDDDIASILEDDSLRQPLRGNYEHVSFGRLPEDHRVEDFLHLVRRTALSAEAVVFADEAVEFIGGDDALVRAWLRANVQPLRHPDGLVAYRWGDVLAALSRGATAPVSTTAGQPARAAFVDPDPNSPVVSVRVAARILKCGRNRIFELLKQEKLRRAVGVPSRGTHVTRASLRAFIASMTPPLPPPKPPRRGSRPAPTALPDPEALRARLKEQRRRLFKKDPT